MSNIKCQILKMLQKYNYSFIKSLQSLLHSSILQYQRTAACNHSLLFQINVSTGELPWNITATRRDCFVCLYYLSLFHHFKIKALQQQFSEVILSYKYKRKHHCFLRSDAGAAQQEQHSRLFENHYMKGSPIDLKSMTLSLTHLPGKREGEYNKSCVSHM